MTEEITPWVAAVIGGPLWIVALYRLYVSPGRKEKNQ